MIKKYGQSVAIVGMGRFGKTLYRLLGGSFTVVAWDADPGVRRGLQLGRGDVVARKESDIFACDVIFYAVPISKFKKTILSHRSRLEARHLLIDVLSVKVHPAEVVQALLKGAGAPRVLLTHPMFGPDSSVDGFKGLPMVMSRFTSRRAEYDLWRKFFVRQGLKVVELSPVAHDRLAANSQGVVHFLGRMLEEFGFKPTEIDTLGAVKLHELETQVCRDTKELFMNLQNYNPYTRDMRIRVGRAYDKLYEKLLPKQVERGLATFGIQGGQGSFNEQALSEYVARHSIKNYKTKYLFTSDRVLRYLHEGRIDFGVFAIQNVSGGVVRESIVALSKYNCRIKEEFPVLIRHFLMRRKNSVLASPKEIMAHEQVFRQCKNNLERRYPHAKLVTGKGDLIDTARAAQALANGRLSKDIFILGPKSLAGLYDLEIVDQDLQDDKENKTTFLVVSRS